MTVTDPKLESSHTPDSRVSPSWLILVLILVLSTRFYTDMFMSSMLNQMLLCLIIGCSLFLAYRWERIPIKSLRTLLVWSGVVIGITIIDIGLGKTIDFSEPPRLISLLLIATFAQVLIFDRTHSSNNYSEYLKFYFYLSLVPLAIGIYNALTGNYVVVEDARRLQGCYSFPNVYGDHLLFSACWFVLAKMRGYLKLSWMIILAYVFVASALFTQIMSFRSLLFVIVFLFLMFMRGRKLSSQVINLLIFAVVTVVLGVVMYYTLDYFRLRVDKIVTSGFFISDTDHPKNSFQWRLFNWAFYLANQKDYILGDGIGSTHFVYLQDLSDLKFSVFDVHNEWLRVFLEFGAIGLLVFFFFIKSIMKPLSYEMRAFIISFLVISSLGNTFRGTAIVVLVVLFVQFYEKGRQLAEQNSEKQ